jgi:hypothetical protein
MAFVFPLAGAIIGHVALNQMRDGRIVDTNRSLAKAGLILGWVFTALGFLFLVLYVLLAVWAVSESYDLTTN